MFCNSNKLKDKDIKNWGMFTSLSNNEASVATSILDTVLLTALGLIMHFHKYL